MEEIKISKALIDKLNELTTILIDKNYFAIEENAIEYVERIFDFIKKIPKYSKLKCKNSGHGYYYSKFKMNRHTTYYITFDNVDNMYLVKNIFSNHEKACTIFIK